MAIGLRDLSLHFRRMQEVGLRDLVVELAHAGGEEGVERGRANVDARLTVRSRKLKTSIRYDVTEQPDTVRLALQAGGDWQGLRVPYASVQDEPVEHVIRSKRPGGMLAIPVGPALTGDEGGEVSRSPTPKLVPHLIFIPRRGEGPGAALANSGGGVLINRFTGEVWFVLVPQVKVTGVGYLLDAHKSIVEDAEKALGDALVKATDPEARP